MEHDPRMHAREGGRGGKAAPEGWVVRLATPMDRAARANPFRDWQRMERMPL